MAGFGFYAVLAFFVLSGFVIHLRLAQRPEEPAQQGRPAWAAAYGWRRALRVYPPLIAALLLTAGLTALGSRLFEGWPWPQGTLPDARNVLMPVFGASTFANGGALWSVAYEVWFYLAYIPVAFLVIAAAGRGSMRRRTGLVLAGSLALAAQLLLVRDQAPDLIPAEVYGLTTIAIYFPAWAAGAFVGQLYADGVQLPQRRLVAAAAGVLVVAATFHSGNQLRPTVDLVWALAISLLIAVLTLRPERDRLHGRVGRWAASTASWSYSLYLVHLPVIYFAQAALGYDAGRRITSPLVVLAIFLIALLAGWLFSLAVERPTLWLLSRRVRSPVTAPAPSI